MFHYVFESGDYSAIVIRSNKVDVTRSAGAGLHSSVQAAVLLSSVSVVSVTALGFSPLLIDVCSSKT